ncbi:hypothetical protein [Sphingobacterium tabacisoli]|uniref:Lipoprotein n=1 Tax=Sphingobacterium tabacisoli TaxID=2044855 RepID=A0ABW5L343_9SPHI|nr:hypothetical protein [Sphingobacterium tabacisoli]
MSWYTNYQKKRNTITLGLLGLGVMLSFSCESSSAEKKGNLTTSEFDVPSFFQKEIVLLNTTKPKIKKTVLKDSIFETKELVIADWNKELTSFLAVDLNKAAYRGTFQKDSTGNTVVYTFTDSTVDLSSLKIVYVDNIPTEFSIKKSTQNLLYNTSENLEYIKGKSYTIDKLQSVYMLGAQHYRITGILE